MNSYILEGDKIIVGLSLATATSIESRMRSIGSPTAGITLLSDALKK